MPNPRASLPRAHATRAAQVLEPVKGFYKDAPVAVLDFASLYPSIIRAYNLSHDTLVASEAEARRLGVAYNLTPEGTVFVKPEVKAGILPLVCKTLLDARKQAKKQMKEAGTEFEKAVFNGKQASVCVCGVSRGCCTLTIRAPSSRSKSRAIACTGGAAPRPGGPRAST